MSEELKPCPTTPETWMPEARQIAGQCWCDPETEDRVMDVALAEAFAKRIANWMDSNARQCRDTSYYRDLIIRCGNAIGEAAFIDDVGGRHTEVLCAKVPELVEGLANRRANFDRIASLEKELAEWKLAAFKCAVYRADEKPITAAEWQTAQASQLTKLLDDRDSLRQQLAEAKAEVEQNALTIQQLRDLVKCYTAEGAKQRQEIDSLTQRLKAWRECAEAFRGIVLGYAPSRLLELKDGPARTALATFDRLKAEEPAT